MEDSISSGHGLNGEMQKNIVIFCVYSCYTLYLILIYSVLNLTYCVFIVSHMAGTNDMPRCACTYPLN